MIQSLQNLIDCTIKMVNDLVSTRSEKEDNLNNLENKLEIQTNGISALEGEITVKEYDNYDAQKKE